MIVFLETEFKDECKSFANSCRLKEISEIVMGKQISFRWELFFLFFRLKMCTKLL